MERKYGKDPAVALGCNTVLVHNQTLRTIRCGEGEARLRRLHYDRFGLLALGGGESYVNAPAQHSALTEELAFNFATVAVAVCCHADLAKPNGRQPRFTQPINKKVSQRLA